MRSHRTQDLAENTFIWTEAYNCGLLLRPFLESYFQHNSHHINVFCSDKDLTSDLMSFKNVTFHTASLNPEFQRFETSILEGYKNGHQGTARLWTYLIKQRKETYLLHLDADTIFLGEVVRALLDAVNIKDASIAGTRRPYLHRGYRLKGVDGLLLNFRPDSVNTDYFIFNRKKLENIFKKRLNRMVVGKRVGFMPVVDFFDPITFKLDHKNKGIYYLDSPQSGRRATPNLSSASFQNRISFAAVGSGMNFWANPEIEIPFGYKEYALKSFSLYSKYILNQTIDYPILDNFELIEKLERLDVENWTLKQVT